GPLQAGVLVVRRVNPPGHGSTISLADARQINSGKNNERWRRGISGGAHATTRLHAAGRSEFASYTIRRQTSSGIGSRTSTRNCGRPLGSATVVVIGLMPRL